MSGFIYLWENKINGKKYLGSHLGSPNDSYIGSGVYFLSAIKKYGIQNFKRSIIEDNIPNEKLRDREQYYLDLYNVVNNDEFYNISPHASGGFFHINSNIELKEENSNRFRNLFNHIEHPRGFKGKTHSKEAWDKTRSRWKKWADENLKRPVEQYSKEGKFIREFESITAAAKSVNGSPSNIKYAIEGKFKTAYKHTWKYAQYN